ncbi:uncharacterized protein EV422DRAFT_209951 [Fimicolochytrium jonesii]|uniref:uncharacterized protein n=1 Tax=Fimicolochytrium jonesii TaxID=1396493 RepID=UPI0022FECB97|nr:uncharacterized protein EV422DRAFT_209951 [Fimicolochytrium jonesii]KAI8817633.1 hypothetical protein EV422DRAFT_209951 [Fimicolochytrium jonesii]
MTALWLNTLRNFQLCLLWIPAFGWILNYTFFSSRASVSGSARSSAILPITMLIAGFSLLIDGGSRMEALWTGIWAALLIAVTDAYTTHFSLEEDSNALQQAQAAVPYMAGISLVLSVFQWGLMDSSNFSTLVIARKDLWAACGTLGGCAAVWAVSLYLSAQIQIGGHSEAFSSHAQALCVILYTFFSHGTGVASSYDRGLKDAFGLLLVVLGMGIDIWAKKHQSQEIR